jgi:isopenicillin N synthase-like dioxygenase
MGNAPASAKGIFYLNIIDPSYRDVLIEYSSKTKAIRDLILRAMANLLKLDENYFANRFTSKALALARLGYYPPCPRPDLVLGFKPHCDGGALSILFVEEHTRGLQVLKDGKWYDVLCEPYTLLINIAECMEVGTYKATNISYSLLNQKLLPPSMKRCCRFCLNLDTTKFRQT